MILLTDSFLSRYDDQPKHMSPMSSFVFYRTYSRFLEKEGRRETFKEAIARAVEYNVNIAVNEWKSKSIKAPIEKIKEEAEVLFDNVFNLKQFLSGRTHWVGGSKEGVEKLYPTSNFNCSFIEVESWNDIVEVFYLLLVGTGVGIGCSKESAFKLPTVRRNFEVIHSEFVPMNKEHRLENTKLEVLENGFAKMYIGDSKNAWSEALNMFITMLTSKMYDGVHTIKISYNSIRPKGERLKTFGGTASGHESLKDMFIGIEKVLKNSFDDSLDEMEMDKSVFKGELERYHVRPIHIMDICNLIGNNVVVGGVRRTAEIFLLDYDDYECMFAKYGINGIWNIKNHLDVIDKAKKLKIDTSNIEAMKLEDKDVKPIHSRRMSNNSVRFFDKPDEKLLDLMFSLIKGEGEPGFVNMASAIKRRPNAKGTNPCGEVLLDSKGMCNLTTVNVASFVKSEAGVPVLDFSGLAQAQTLSVRAGMRMTCLNLELDSWNFVQQRDRLIGASLTGWKDAMGVLNYTVEQEEQLLSALRDIAHETAHLYAYTLRIPMPLLITTIKPEGTLSQVANGVSSGLHKSFAKYYIRRIRISSKDPLVSVARELGWNIFPEVGQDVNSADTLVLEFPVESGANNREEDTALTQLDNYFMFQDYYTDHNSSNTIYVKDDEWDSVKEKIKDKWDDFIGVSFLSYDGGSYKLAPYEEIDEVTFKALSKRFKSFDVSLLHKYEKHRTEEDLGTMEACATGACPIK